MTATTQRIQYTAKRNQTGLTDVKIDIYDASDTLIVNQQTLTELAGGLYYYDYTPVSAGWHIWQADSDTAPSSSEGRFLSDFIDITPITDTVYCTASDVQRIIQPENAFDSDTNPSLTEVNAFIAAKSEFIDGETGHAWRSRTVTDEYYDIKSPSRRHGYGRGHFHHIGIPVRLRNRKIRTFDTSEGDKLEIWDGNSYVDWITDKTEGRNEDFWVDHTDGIIYLRHFYPYFREKGVRITYRFGEITIPTDIRDAAAFLVAADIISADDRSQVVPETGDPTRMTHDNRVSRWRNNAWAVMNRRKEIKAF